MKYQLDNQPTREIMIEEFGGDPARLARAMESIRSAAVPIEEFEWEKQAYGKEATAHMLNLCGLVEPLALFATRLGGGFGRISILFSNQAVERIDGILRIRAEFDAAGTLKAMEGIVDEGEPFGLGVNYLAFRSASDLQDSAWLEEREAEIAEYEEARSRECPDWSELVTVIRYPLSCVQGYRKFIAERWHDPDVATVERFECPLDRDAFDRFEIRASSVRTRFEKELAEIKDRRG